MPEFGGIARSESVSTDSIIFNPLNVRGILRTLDQIKRTAQSLREVGLLHNPIISLMEYGYMVVAGEARVLAHKLLSQVEGFKAYSQISCKVLVGVSEKLAMKILCEENLCHGTIVPAATANELYWHYRVDYEATGDADVALNKIHGVWKSPDYVYNSFIVPGWLIYHSPTVQSILRQAGPRREGLYEPGVQNIIEKLQEVRVGWWRIISAPFTPVRPEGLVSSPSQNFLQYFDGLMLKTFDILEDPYLRGDRAEEELEKLSLPLRRVILEGMLDHKENLPEEIIAQIESELIALNRMIRKRGINK